jgi:integrase
MRAIIGAKLLTTRAAQPGEKPFEIRDVRLPGFLLRVQPSGVRSYYAEWARGKRLAIGKVGHLLPDEARERCEKVLGNVAHGREPLHGLEGTESGPTLKEFLDGAYGPWVLANRPRGAEATLARIEACFSKWYSQPLGVIDVEQIEKWRTARLTEGAAPATVMRDITSLSGALSHAVKLKKLTENPVRHVDKPKIDRNPKVRYLDAAEEKRLREALAARDLEAREARARTLAGRRKQHADLEPIPEGGFADHLTPAVMLSLNTGLRRGELLALKWSDFELTGANPQLTVHGASAKSAQTRHVPLNADAVNVLTQWKKQAPDADRVFPIATSMKRAWVALLKVAKIRSFRWHDLRHHFASRLVQAGVPLNTVRDLLGHASLAMTLRYAHLAPDQKREAVAKLVAP